jgi:hypothetical protein
MLVFFVLHALANCCEVLAHKQHIEHVDDNDHHRMAQHAFGASEKTGGVGTAEEEYHSRFGPQIDLPFSGPLSFAHIPYTRCLDDLHSATTPFDIAVLGMPFDTAVTYRPGARFGPYGIRSGSRRLWGSRAYSLAWENTPYSDATTIVDCGDVSHWSFFSCFPLPFLFWFLGSKWNIYSLTLTSLWKRFQ